MRILFGITIIVGSVFLSIKLKEYELKKNKERYERCLATGQKPIICSFLAAFRRD